MFKMMRSAIDKRPKEIECNKCGKRFTNRLQREQHDESTHGRDKTKYVNLESILLGFAGTLKDVMVNNTEKKTGDN